MRYQFSIALFCCLVSASVHAAPNCQHSNSWQCNHASGNSGQGSQAASGVATGGSTPHTSTTNNHLTTGATNQPVMTITPVPGHTITGYAPVPSQQPHPKPYPVPNAVPQKQPVAVPPKVPMVVPPTPVMKKPPKATVQTPPIQVYLVPTPVITGQSAVPHQVPTAAPPKQPVAIPPKQPTATPPIQVHPVPTPVITGQSAVPHQVPIAVPPKQAVATPPKQPTATPPIQVTPVPTPILVGYAAVPTPNPVATPPLQPQPIPSQQPIVTPPKQPVATPSTKPATIQTGAHATHLPGVTSPVIITHAPDSRKTSGYKQMQVSGTSLTTQKQVMNELEVKVYHGKDVSKMAYKNTHEMDKKGFYMSVIGTREPDFTDDVSKPDPVGVSADFVFYFDFASAVIHPEQRRLFDKIIEARHRHNKRIIVMGETDNFGSFEFNKHLAITRSTEIINELKKRGIKDDEIELRILVRCCRKELHPTKQILEETRHDRITWIHFE